MAKLFKATGIDGSKCYHNILNMAAVKSLGKYR
jgi:hypothetical protein